MERLDVVRDVPVAEGTLQCGRERELVEILGWLENEPKTVELGDH